METKTTPDPAPNPAPKTAQETYWARQHPRTETDGQPLIVPDYYGDNEPVLDVAHVFLMSENGTVNSTLFTGTLSACRKKLFAIAELFVSQGWGAYIPSTGTLELNTLLRDKQGVLITPSETVRQVFQIIPD